MKRSFVVPNLMVVLLLILTGCSLDGRGALPFSRGVGGDSYEVTVHMADVANLVPNAEVKVNDVTVGTVTRISMADWEAVLTVSLAAPVRLPANSIANVGQKSLLGAQYLQLAAPSGTKPVGRLTAGGVIPIEHTGTYPATEDLLIAVSAFLNGSGLTQLKTITTELNQAFANRTDDVRALLGHLRQVAGKLAEQRGTITRLLDRMDQLTETLAAQTPKIDRALPELAPGLAALDDQRPALVRALNSVEQLNAVTTPVLRANRADLVQELRDLRPTIGRLADVGPSDLTGSLNYLGTVIYPLDKVDDYYKGDYINLFMNIDLRVPTLQKTLLAESDVETGQSSAGSLSTLMTPTAQRGAR